MKTFQLDFNDGTAVILQPGTEGKVELFIDDQLFIIYESGAIEEPEKKNLTISKISEVNEFRKSDANSEVETIEIDGILRYCIICGGRRYCITGGCANTPCGWICG